MSYDPNAEASCCGHACREHVVHPATEHLVTTSSGLLRFLCRCGCVSDRWFNRADPPVIRGQLSLVPADSRPIVDTGVAPLGATVGGEQQ